MGFLLNFSGPFRAALAWWPLLALVLTLPIIVVRALGHRRITWPYLLLSYLVVLYGLGLGFFTLYPMPADPARYCATHAVQTQPVPFHWVLDVAGPHPRLAVLQLLANVVFFVPLGMSWWMLLRGTVARAALAGLTTSLLVETAQLTGIFGVYPCSYRLFDVDDLAVNTLGAVLGFLLARALRLGVSAPSLSAPALPRTPLNLVLARLVDVLLVCIASGAAFLVLYPVAGGLRANLFLLVLTAWSALLLLVQRRCRATPGEMLVGVAPEPRSQDLARGPSSRP